MSGDADGKEVKIVNDNSDLSKANESQKDVVFNKRELQDKVVCEYKFSDVSITVPYENIHVGTRITINGPIIITNMRDTDLKLIERNCICSNTKKESLSKEKGNKIKTGRNVLQSWNLKKCVTLGFAITLIEIIVLTLNFVTLSNSHSLCSDKIDERKVNAMNVNLKKFEQRYGWRFYRNDCTYECYIRIKSKIRLVIPMHSSYWFDCLYKKQYCKSFFDSEQMYFHTLPVPFNDIYYNYIIGMKGEIYEARSLNCPFDDESLEEDHSLIISVGIAYCFPGDARNNKIYATNQLNAINELAYKLRLTGILGENYFIEFPDFCNNSLLANFTSKTHPVSFYNTNNSLYNNTSPFWNPRMIENLLFKTRDTNNSDEPKIIHRNPSIHPIAEYDSRCENLTDQNKSVIFDRLQIQLTFSVDRYLIAMCGNLTLCLSKIIEINQRVTNLKSRLFNYYVYLRSSSVFEGVSLNCSLNLENYKNVVNILVIDSLHHRDPDMKIYTLSTVLPEILKHIRSNINYSDLTIEIPCYSDFSTIVSAYELLIDAAFVTKTGVRLSSQVACLPFA